MVKEIPDRWADLGEFIRQQRETARLSLRRLSVLTGISNPYLSQIERGLRKPSAEILQQIAKGLQLSAETLYVRAGILEADSDEHDLVRRIRTDLHLDPIQREALVRIYLSFRHENGYVDVVEDDDAEDEASSDSAGPGDASSASGPGSGR
ncbi:MAG: helix-turn-helix domain-containing protein [Acidimicrobiales bacterium]|jgi:transcriptional regulator with XRE-family HTH domain